MFAPTSSPLLLFLPSSKLILELIYFLLMAIHFGKKLFCPFSYSRSCFPLFTIAELLSGTNCTNLFCNSIRSSISSSWHLILASNPFKLERLVLFKGLLVFVLKSFYWKYKIIFLFFTCIFPGFLVLRKKILQVFGFQLESKEDLTAEYMFYLRNPIFHFLNCSNQCNSKAQDTLFNVFILSVRRVPLFRRVLKLSFHL